MGFSRQEYCPFLSPGDLPIPGIEPWSPILQADSLPSEPSKVMLKILQVRLPQYVNWLLPNIQVGFRKGRAIRDQIANIGWIIEKAKEFQKNIYFCFIDYAKAFDCVDHNRLWKMGIPGYLICLQKNLNTSEEATSRTRYGTADQFKIGKEYHNKAVYCHPANLTYIA